MRTKCLDTYALMEISRGNSNFAEYLLQDFVIVDSTLAEFYGVLLREEGESIAETWFRKLGVYSRPADKNMLVQAIKFRYEQKKKRISFFDAVGYIFSIKNNFIFVTGDKEFENIKEVEFKKNA